MSLATVPPIIADSDCSGRCSMALRLALVALLSVHAGLLAWMAERNSPTLDEVAHLPAGLSHLQYGNFELYHVNPPLVRTIAALPLLFVDAQTNWQGVQSGPTIRSEFTVGKEFLEANGPRSFWFFTLGRWACIPLSLLGGYICFRWARELYGTVAGLTAAAFWCFSPNVLGNAAMITPDTGGASLGVAAAYVFWHWLRQPAWRTAIVAGLVLGVAELAKSLWIVFFPLWPTLWLISVATVGCTAGRRRLGFQAVQLAAMLLVGLGTLNLGYLGEGTGTKLKDFRFISQALNGKGEAWQVGNRFENSLLGELPIPFPRNFVRGIDMQRADFERGKTSYLRGEQRFGGWWYYYFYAVAVKEPLGTLLCGLLALGLQFIRTRRAGPVTATSELDLSETIPKSTPRSSLFRADWRDTLAVLAPALVILVLVSSQTGFNRYLRYLLPAFPFVYVWISQVVRNLAGRRWIAYTAAALLAWTITSSLWVFPHSLSYFNELAGGPTGGPAHLLDANIDWGQDLLNLKRWLDAHPEAKPLRLAYFGFVDPQLAGIEYEVPPPGPSPQGMSPLLEALGPWPGWQAVSVNYVHGYRHYEEPAAWFTYYQQFQPVARAGHSILIYHITLEEANAVRKRMGLTPLSAVRPPTNLLAPRWLHSYR